MAYQSWLEPCASAYVELIVQLYFHFFGVFCVGIFFYFLVLIVVAVMLLYINDFHRIRMLSYYSIHCLYTLKSDHAYG